jgi:hypothetical protein
VQLPTGSCLRLGQAAVSTGDWASVIEQRKCHFEEQMPSFSVGFGLNGLLRLLGGSSVTVPLAVARPLQAEGRHRLIGPQALRQVITCGIS